MTEALVRTTLPDDPEAHAPRRGDWLVDLREQARADRRLTVFALVVPVVLFFVELTHCTVSVDENLQQFQSDVPREWLAQGRWGMALLTALTPPLHSIPFLAPALFCLGLSVSALLLSLVAARTPLEKYVFVGFFVASPLWPNLAEFNTLSWGIGLALVCLALAVHLLQIGEWWSSASAVLLLALSAGIYQTSVMIFAAIAISLVVAVAGYLVAQQTALVVLGPRLEYVNGVIVLTLNPPTPSQEAALGPGTGEG